MLASPQPRVALPSQSGLNPNLSLVLDMPAQALARGRGPRSVAVLCDGIATGLFQAADSGMADGQHVTRDDLDAAGDWFAATARVLEGCQQ